MYRRAAFVIASVGLLVGCDDRPEIPGSYPSLEDDEARLVYTIDDAPMEASGDAGISFDGAYAAYRLQMGAPVAGVWFPETAVGSYQGDAETTSVRLMFDDGLTSATCFSSAMGAVTVTVAGSVETDSDTYLYGDFQGLVCNTATPVQVSRMKGQFSARLDVESQSF